VGGGISKYALDATGNWLAAGGAGGNFSFHNGAL